MSVFKDLTGGRFGRLTVLCETNFESSYRYWLCACDCGQTKAVLRSSLTRGKTRSCGCYNSEFQKKQKFKHGLCATNEYVVWAGMIQRCENPKHTAFKNYGGRGIAVSSEWHDFRNFMRDMGPRPPGLSVDRIDNNGNYCKENCKWSTSSEQALNRRKKSA